MRKGQVTIFVILGLVLLLVAGLFITLRQNTVPANPPVTQLTHDFSQVLASYEMEASRCFERESSRVFRQLFSQGGYTDPAAQGFIAIDGRPTSGSALLLGEDHLVPYWMEQRGGAGCIDDCRIKFHIPPLHRGEGEQTSIEEQASLLLKPLIKPCLDNIRFSDDYEVEMADNYNVTVYINEESISYKLLRLVNFTFVQTGARMTAEKVTARSDTKIQALYENGLAVLNDAFIANKTDTVPQAIKLIIQSYGLGDDPEIPPMNGGTVFESGKRTMWLLPDVQRALQHHLVDNIPLIQFRHTAEQQIMLDPNRYSQAMYHTGPFRPDIIFPYQDMLPYTSVSLMYLPSWEPDLDINPGSYVLQPNGFDINLGIIDPFGFYEYYFRYNIVVPILVTVTDYSAFNGEGLSLIFAVETGLSQNKPLLYADPVDRSQVVDDAFADEDFRMPGFYTITAHDSLSGKPLANVEVTYLCGAQGVDLGRTDEEYFTLFTDLPFCLGGQLLGALDGYYGDGVPLSVFEDEDKDISLGLTPIKTFKLQLEGYSLFQNATEDGGAGTWVPGNQKFNLGVDDLLTIIFTRKVLPGQPDNVQVVVANYSNAGSLEVELAKGLYNVEAYLITTLGKGHVLNQFVIPSRKPCDDCDVLKPIYFNSTIYRGGVFLTGDNALEVTEENYVNDTLVLQYFTLLLSDLDIHEELDVFDKFDEYSKKYNETINPYFIDSTVGSVIPE